MHCRHCQAALSLSLVDLGCAPPSNAYLTADDLQKPELWYPLRVLVCERCWLVQTADFARADQLFDADYAYFSSYSTTWLTHAERYVDAVIERFGLSAASRVVEVAANDGYLLQFVQRRGIPCTGVEPTASTAAAARTRGIPIVQDFFGERLAEQLLAEDGPVDLMVANNVLAHVPDINDFVRGFRRLLKPRGVATFEFPHLLRLISDTQFDTIYHEHFSYLSLTAAERIFRSCGLQVFDVVELPTHGGSLRVFAQRLDTGAHPLAASVTRLLDLERRASLDSPAGYAGFQAKTDLIKDSFLEFLLSARRQGRKVAAYGAAAKGNTLLNYAGVRRDLLPYVVDRNPAKQGKYLPGSRIPIVPEARIRDECPVSILVLPWNLRSEVMDQLAYVREWGARFVTFVPELVVS
jgi:2-polyprenyl-3-methyl-5-hydroxy-6-metoxy-1,4-benzoquinol methylase